MRVGFERRRRLVMSENFRQREQISALHRVVRCERVAQIVKAEVSDSRETEHALPRRLRVERRSRLALFVLRLEHPFGERIACGELSEHPSRAPTQRNVARLSALAVGHENFVRLEVHILPAQREQFAFPHSGFEREIDDGRKSVERVRFVAASSVRISSLERNRSRFPSPSPT